MPDLPAPVQAYVHKRLLAPARASLSADTPGRTPGCLGRGAGHVRDDRFAAR